jgi:hypothetical protein
MRRFPLEIMLWCDDGDGQELSMVSSKSQGLSETIPEGLPVVRLDQEAARDLAARYQYDALVVKTTAHSATINLVESIETSRAAC